MIGLLREGWKRLSITLIMVSSPVLASHSYQVGVECENSQEIITSTFDLSQRAQEFADLSRWQNGFNQLYSFAIELMRAADDFIVKVENGRDCEQLKDDFHFVVWQWLSFERQWQRAASVRPGNRLQDDYNELEYSFRYVRYQVFSDSLE
ncbi:MAG: hypothetical protein R3B45_07830 [Bdellovibrionota bacterium]